MLSRPCRYLGIVRWAVQQVDSYAQQTHCSTHAQASDTLQEHTQTAPLSSFHCCDTPANSQGKTLLDNKIAHGMIQIDTPSSCKGTGRAWNRDTRLRKGSPAAGHPQVHPQWFHQHHAYKQQLSQAASTSTETARHRRARDQNYRGRTLISMLLQHCGHQEPTTLGGYGKSQYINSSTAAAYKHEHCAASATTARPTKPAPLHGTGHSQVQHAGPLAVDTARTHAPQGIDSNVSSLPVLRLLSLLLSTHGCVCAQQWCHEVSLPQHPQHTKVAFYTRHTAAAL
jgi:hypothetical protein